MKQIISWLIESTEQILTRGITKNNASYHLISTPIQSKKELSSVIQTLITTLVETQRFDAVEVALYNRDSGRYSHSLSVGIPFRASIDEVMSNAQDPSYAETNCIREDISFAGVIIGAVRARCKNKILNKDQILIQDLAQKVTLAVVNTNFVTEIQKAQTVTKDSMKAKTGFLASLSHELRGPLGVILNASEILKDELAGPLNDQQKEMLSMTLRNGEHLLELLNDVLDYARIESGKVQPQLISIQIPGALSELLSVIRVQSELKKQKLILNASLETNLLCDRRHFRQILINLLTNAVKYTPEHGTITVTAESLIGSKVKITVSDSGCGIEKEDFSKVFAAFERIQKGYASKQSGTGLGLSLTKKLVELNGGFIDFTSSLNAGSNFFCIFQEEESTNITDETHLDVESSKFIEGSILFIGLATDENNICTKFLSDIGYKLSIVSTLSQMESFKNSSHVLIVDESISEMIDGFTVKSVRDILGAYMTPLIYLSRNAFEFSVEEQLRQGVDRFVAKPCSLKELSKVIQKLLSERSKDLSVEVSSKMH